LKCEISEQCIQGLRDRLTVNENMEASSIANSTHDMLL